MMDEDFQRILRTAERDVRIAMGVSFVLILVITVCLLLLHRELGPTFECGICVGYGIGLIISLVAWVWHQCREHNELITIFALAESQTETNRKVEEWIAKK